MRYLLRCFILISLILILQSLPVYSKPKQEELRIGIFPEIAVFQQKERFDELGEYLSKKIGIPVKFTLVIGYDKSIDHFVIDELDGAFFDSFSGALAIQHLGAIPIVRPVDLDNESSYRGYIFVRKGNGIKSVKNMKGKTMAFVEKATVAGYVFPLVWLRGQGVPTPERYFGTIYFAGSNDAVIMEVLDKQADVGAAKSNIYERFRRKNPRIDQELMVLAVSAPVPSDGLLVRKSLDPLLRQKLKEVLLGMRRDPEGKFALEQMDTLYFIETSTKDYEPVFEMAAKAGMDIKKFNNEKSRVVSRRSRRQVSRSRT